MSKRHNDQRNPGQLSPSLRRSKTRIIKSAPPSEPHLQVQGLPALNQHSESLGSFLDDESAYFEKSITTKEDIKNQNVKTSGIAEKEEVAVENRRSNSPGEHIAKAVSFSVFHDHRDKESPNIESQIAKSCPLEAKKHGGDEKKPDVVELTFKQSQPETLPSDEAERVKETIHNQNQPPDLQLPPINPVTGVQQEIESLQSKHSKEITDLQTELQLAKNQRSEYHRNFLDAQEQVFSLQPRRSDITEDAAISEYSSLCIAVENWIESHLNDVLDLDAKIFAQSPKVDLTSGSRLLGLIELTPGGAKSKDVPGTLEYYLRNAIMSFICEEVFKPELYNAIGGPWKFLRTIETTMATLEPRRDRATIRAWRSETLTALIATAEYQNARSQRIAKLAFALCGCLQVLLPRASKELLATLQKSLAGELIVPAMRLSETFHLSAKIYSYNCRGLDRDSADVAPEVDAYECRNLLENGKVLKTGTLQPGVQCRYIIDVCPGLCCSSIKTDMTTPAKQLTKAQILIAVQRPDRAYSLTGETAIGHIYRSIQRSKR